MSAGIAEVGTRARTDSVTLRLAALALQRCRNEQLLKRMLAPRKLYARSANGVAHDSASVRERSVRAARAARIRPSRVANVTLLSLLLVSVALAAFVIWERSCRRTRRQKPQAGEPKYARSRSTAGLVSRPGDPRDSSATGTELGGPSTRHRSLRRRSRQPARGAATSTRSWGNRRDRSPDHHYRRRGRAFIIE